MTTAVAAILVNRGAEVWQPLVIFNDSRNDADSAIYPLAFNVAIENGH
jgi:hypothetical protein